MNIEKAIIGNTVIFGYNDEDIFENIRNSGRFFEQDILDRWLPYYRNAKTIMDVGANLGNHTLYFCKNTKANSIYAFEPYVDNYRLLNRNVKFNDCGNVICNQFAVGGTTGKAVPVRLPDKRYLGNVQYRYADDSDADTQHSVQNFVGRFCEKKQHSESRFFKNRCRRIWTRNIIRYERYS